MAGRSHLLVIPVRSSTEFLEAKTCFTCHVSDPDCVPFYNMDSRPFINASAYAPWIAFIKQLHPATKRTTTA